MSSRAFASLLAVLTLLASLLALPIASAATPVFSATTPIVPASGTRNGGTEVTITGSGFDAGALVTFDGVAATNIQVTATSIKATTPATTVSGAVNVVVTNPNGLGTTQTNGFTYTPDPAPTLTTFSLSSGSANGNSAVNIKGTGFSTAIFPKVTFGGKPALVTFATATNLTAVTPPGTGAVSIVLTNPDGQVSNTPSLSYTYLAESPPTVTGITPVTGLSNGGALITLTGTGFAAGATVAFNQAGGKSAPAASVIFVSSTQLLVTAPSIKDGTGDLANALTDIVVTNPDNVSPVTLAGAYSFAAANAPTVNAVTPNKGPINGGTAITIGGTGFATGKLLKVKIGATDALNVKFVSATQITAVIPSGLAAGALDVTVLNPDAQVSATNANAKFTVKAQIAVDSLATGLAVVGSADDGPSSTSAFTNGQTSVRLTGKGFTAGVRDGAEDAGCRVFLGSVEVIPTVALPITCAAGQVDFIAPAATAGARDVTVVNVDNGLAATLQGGLTYVGSPSPTFDLAGTPVTPQERGSNGGTTVVLAGTNFVKVTDSAGVIIFPTVHFGSTAAVVTVATATSITAVVPPAAASGISGTTCPTVHPLIPCLPTSIKVTNADGASVTLLPYGAADSTSASMKG